MQNPIRRSIVTGAALLVVSFMLSACTGSAPAVVTTITTTKTVAAPSPSAVHASGTVLSTSSAVAKAATRLQEVTIATGIKIAEDAANPNSYCESFDGSFVGNKRLAQVRGLEKKAGFPEIFIRYYQKSRRLALTSFTSLNPAAPLDKERYDGIDMTFESTDPQPNNLERKLAVHKQLTANDFIAFFRASNLGMRSLTMTHNNAMEASITLSGKVYLFKNYTDQNGVPINDNNSGVMDRMGRDLELTEIELRHGL